MSSLLKGDPDGKCKTKKEDESNIKRIFLLRHGQAQHNPRAEEAKSNGCSHETFLKLIKEDDALDASLTSIGEDQARKVNHEYFQNKLHDVQLIVSSPLSRALQTADLTICPFMDADMNLKRNRICVEYFREINGYFLNAKRKSKTELRNLFHKSWDFDTALFSEYDQTWNSTKLEDEIECAERGYLGLLWLIQNRIEDNILVVAHGAILRYSMLLHPLIKVVDGRSDDEKRFGNCELREYEMNWYSEGLSKSPTESDRPLITLTEIR